VRRARRLVAPSETPLLAGVVLVAGAALRRAAAGTGGQEECEPRHGHVSRIKKLKFLAKRDISKVDEFNSGFYGALGTFF